MNVYIGNIGSEPELKRTSSGISVLSFSLATSKRVKDGNDWKDGPTSWRRVTVWRGLAEGLADQLSKGKRVIVVGEEEVRQYETTDGKGTSVEVTADHVGLYLFPKRAGDRPAPSSVDQGADSWATPATFGDETPF